MPKITAVIVEDNGDCAIGIETVLKRSHLPIGKFFHISLFDVDPSFEQIDEMLRGQIEDGEIVIVFLDHELNGWKYNGGHLAASCEEAVVVCISSEPRYWSKYQFGNKVDIAYHESAEAGDELVAVVEQALRESPCYQLIANQLETAKVRS